MSHYSEFGGLAFTDSGDILFINTANNPDEVQKNKLSLEAA